MRAYQPCNTTQGSGSQPLAANSPTHSPHTSGCRTNESCPSAPLAAQPSDAVGRHAMSENAANSSSMPSDAAAAPKAVEYAESHSATDPSSSTHDRVTEMALTFSTMGGPSTSSAQPPSQTSRNLCPGGSRNLCPGAIIFDRLFRRNPRVAGSAFFLFTLLTPLVASRPLNPRPGSAAP